MLIMKKEDFLIKLEAIDSFTLSRINEISNLERNKIIEDNMINKGDRFECKKDLAEYLLGKNDYGKAFVKIIEVIPDRVSKKIK